MGKMELKDSVKPGMTSNLFISRSSFASNLRWVRSNLNPSVKICATLKGDAYGHGIYELSKVACKNEIDYIGISSNEEAEAVFFINPKTSLIRLRPAFPYETECLIRKNIFVEEQAGSWVSAVNLNKIGEKFQTKIKVHLNLDSGMGRSGFYYKKPDIKDKILKIPSFPFLEIVGIMTHFPNADAENVDSTVKSLNDFIDFVSFLKQQNTQYRNSIVHCASSASFLRIPETHLDMIRPGAVLYGNRTSEYVPMSDDIKQVMTWKTKIVHVSEVDADTPIGYGTLYKTNQPTKIATIPIGLCDGYPRSLTNKGYVLIRGIKCPVVGRVSLSLTTVEVPQEIQINDEVILIGSQGQLTIKAEDLAATFSSVHTEIQMAGFHNKRIYVD
ncbi:MAG: alanine racemase [Desulfobacterales bacterium]|nr:alanine racemase [Desulfobacterales bacterium]